MDAGRRWLVPGVMAKGDACKGVSYDEAANPPYRTSHITCRHDIMYINDASRHAVFPFTALNSWYSMQQHMLSKHDMHYSFVVKFVVHKKKHVHKTHSAWKGMHARAGPMRNTEQEGEHLDGDTEAEDQQCKE